MSRQTWVCVAAQTAEQDARLWNCRRHVDQLAHKNKSSSQMTRETNTYINNNNKLRSLSCTCSRAERSFSAKVGVCRLIESVRAERRTTARTGRRRQRVIHARCQRFSEYFTSRQNGRSHVVVVDVNTPCAENWTNSDNRKHRRNGTRTASLLQMLSLAAANCTKTMTTFARRRRRRVASCRSRETGWEQSPVASCLLRAPRAPRQSRRLRLASVAKLNHLATTY